MPINAISYIRDTTLLMRDIISGTIPDPVANRQQLSGDTGSNSQFVMTSWPERFIVYPFITIQHVTATETNLGMQTEDSLTTMRMQVDIWTKRVGQRDGIAGSVHYGLRTSQLGTSGMIGSGLIDFRLVNSRNLDDPGKHGVHRTSQDYELAFIQTT